MLLMLQESSTAIRSLRMFLRADACFRIATFSDYDSLSRGLGPQESIVDYSGTVSRIALRYAFEARICICIQRRGANVVIGGWTRDISESGICAFVAEELRLGELVTLEVPLPDSTTLNIPAKVTRSLGTQYGFRFTALSPEQRAHVQSATRGKTAIPAPNLRQ